MDLQSTDRDKRHNCTVFSFASDHRNSEGIVLQLKMVASVGNAPTFHALQACAHLSKPRSHLKFMVLRGTPQGNLARKTCVKPTFQFTTLSVFNCTSRSANPWAVVVIPCHEPFCYCSLL